MDRKTRINKRTWEAASSAFIHGSALPTWGPFSVGKDLHLIPNIKGKTFLEVGCGSGRSIKYLTTRGAKKVYGLDFSEKQIEEATRFNKYAIDKGVVELIQAPMEKKVKVKLVDIVYSVYAIGWTQNPQKTLSNIYGYLKKGGQFIWSWDHAFFTNVGYTDRKYVVVHSYHDERPIELKNWKSDRFSAHITYRKSATWFRLLKEAGFSIEGYYEPKPKDLLRGHRDPAKYYAIQKAEKVPCSFIFVCKK